jgi:hypothetical protein
MSDARSRRTVTNGPVSSSISGSSSCSRQHASSSARLQTSSPFSSSLTSPCHGAHPFPLPRVSLLTSAIRYFPYFITVGALLVTYIFIILWLVFNQRLLPAIVMIGAFMLFVLWMVGTVVVSVQLFGPDGSIQGNCNLAVFSQNPVGASMSTLAWLQQRSICTFSPKAMSRVLLTLNRPNMASHLRLLHRRLHLPAMDHGHRLPGLRGRIARADRLIAFLYEPYLTPAMF